MRARTLLIAAVCVGLSSCGFVPQPKPYPQPKQYAEFLEDRGRFVVRFSGDGGPEAANGQQAAARVFAAFDRPGRPAANDFNVDIVLESGDLMARYSDDPYNPGRPATRGVLRDSGHRVAATVTVSGPTGDSFTERLAARIEPARGFVGTEKEIEEGFEQALAQSRVRAWDRLLGELCTFLSTHDVTIQPVELALHADETVAAACFEHLPEERVRSSLALEVIKHPGASDGDRLRAVKAITPWDTDDPAFDALRERWIRPDANPQYQIGILKFDHSYMADVREPEALAYVAEYSRLADRAIPEVRSQVITNLERLYDRLLFGYVDQPERRSRQEAFEVELRGLIEQLEGANSE